MGRLRERLRARTSPLLMGVLNCTPDSFSDGGHFSEGHRALRHAESMLSAGADIVDVGAESTRPGSTRIDDREQRARIGTVIRELSTQGALVSIDTTLPSVAAWALDEGACLVNSVELGPAGELARVAVDRGAALCLMHSRGDMTQVAGYSEVRGRYGDVLRDVLAEWEAAANTSLEHGLSKEDVWLDPGLGFHKSAEHSLSLLARASELKSLGHPVLLGPSRKSFLAHVTARPGEMPAPPTERLGATIAACIAAARAGVDVLRVHDVREVRQAIALDRALRGSSEVARA